MDSLPEPSETVEDEWASMKIRFRKEGLDWSKLSHQDRILQVISEQTSDLSCFQPVIIKQLVVNPVFSSKSVSMDCPKCKDQITTTTTKELGALTWLAVGVCCIV